MKKYGLFALTLVLALGMTCCRKKNVEPAATNTSTDKVHIEFNTGNSGSRLGISEAGAVSWSSGDKLWVYSNNNGLLGYISYDGSQFSGTVDSWTNPSDLVFFYLGDYVPTKGKELKIDFSDQSYKGTQTVDNDLANIASKFWVSRATFSGVVSSVRSFNSKLFNMVSMGIFNTSGFGSGNVKLYAASNLKNQISISSTGLMSYGVAGTNLDSPSGHIITGPASEKRYVALLPSGSDVDMQFTSQSKTGSFEIGTIEAGKIYTAGSNNAISITTSDVVSSYVDLAVASDHLFTVASGKTVKFAKGNLVYDQGRFKMHATQADRVWGEVWNSHVVGGTFDHFAFGTSCWNNGSQCYMPYMGKTAVTFGPTDGSSFYDLTGTYANSDWGVYQFGMNTGTSWRTLTKDEWQWLLGPNSDPNPGTNCRNVEKRFLKAHIANVDKNGLIIFPDDFTTTGLSGDYTAYYNVGNSDFITVSADDWTIMETAGAIFLITAGHFDTWVDNPSNSTEHGLYCSSTTSTENDSQAYMLDFAYYPTGSGGSMNPQDQWDKMKMPSVRLVQDVD